MIITEGYARRLMRAGKAIMFRCTNVGIALQLAHTWEEAMDSETEGTASVCLDNDRRYLILDRVDCGRTDHVQI